MISVFIMTPPKPQKIAWGEYKEIICNNTYDRGEEKIFIK